MPQAWRIFGIFHAATLYCAATGLLAWQIPNYEPVGIYAVSRRAGAPIQAGRRSCFHRAPVHPGLEAFRSEYVLARIEDFGPQELGIPRSRELAPRVADERLEGFADDEVGDLCELAVMHRLDP